jgi:NAD(P)-dependent dehydrogenase (short-subunit alcohol dehydrogenase family)
VQFAHELHATGIKVNAADPGPTATDMNHDPDARPVELGARIAVHLAMLTEDGPTGGFFDETRQLPW